MKKLKLQSRATGDGVWRDVEHVRPVSITDRAAELNRIFGWEKYRVVEDLAVNELADYVEVSCPVDPADATQCDACQ